VTWHVIDLPAGRTDGVVRIEVAGRHLAAVHSSGRWRVFEDRCTHADCAFSEFGDVEDGVLICECHGSEFSLDTGDVLLDPAEEPLELFDVRDAAGAYEVELS
jgi:nitrite reductase/ring-hydroxylating ferredoxin subunit